MEDYKQKYHETIESLYFVTRSLSAMERESEINLTILSQLQAIINDFIVQVDKIHGNKKIEWENRVKTLINIFNHIGGIYYSELMFRKKCYKLEKNILDLSRQIDELKAENEKLKQLNEF